MPSHARTSSGDSQAAGRGRQKLKLAAIGYAHSRHGIDADADKIRVAVLSLRKMAIEYVETLPGTHLRNRRLDLFAQGNSEMLEYAAIAYSGARHGVDADVGMAREGMTLLCQEAINFAESLPMAEPKRPVDPHLQIGNGA